MLQVFKRKVQDEGKQTTSYANGPKPGDFFKNIRISAKLSATLQIWDSPAGLQGMMSHAYFAFVVFLFLHMCLLCVGDMYYAGGNITKFAYVMINSIIYGAGTIFMIYYRMAQGTLINMFRFAETHFRYRSARGLTVMTMGPGIKTANQITKVLIMFTFVTSHHWSIDPLIHSGENGERLLPVHVLYPVDIQISPTYEIAFALQVLAQTSMAMMYSNIVCLFASFSLLVCGQLDILCCSIRNVCHTGHLRSGYAYKSLLPRTYLEKAEAKNENRRYVTGDPETIDCHYDQLGEKEYDLKDPKYKAILFKLTQSKNDLRTLTQFKDSKSSRSVNENMVLGAISDCVDHHQTIWKFCKMQQSFFSFPLSMQMMVLAVMSCTALYSTTDNFELKTLEYVFISVLHLLSFCFFGNQIHIESEMVHRAAYAAGWERCGARVRRSLALLMQQAHRPVLLSAGPLIRLNLNNFISTLKASFSFYTLLQNMNAQNQNIH